MKGVYRGLLFVLFAFMMSPLFCLKAQVKVDKANSDSLHNVLQHSRTPQEKMRILRQLAYLYWQQPEEVIYMTQLVELSLQIDSIKNAYYEMTGLCRYYFNISQLDSLIYWRDQIGSLSAKREESPDELYASSGLVAKLYLDQKNFELAMADVIRMQNKAEKENQAYGLVISNEVLGLIYQTLERDSDAMVAFRKGLVWLDKVYVHPAFQIAYFTEMAVSALRNNSLDEAENIIKRYEILYKQEEETAKSKGDYGVITWNAWLVNSFYAELYVRRGQVAKAKPYMEKAINYASQSDNEEMKYHYYYAQIHYYKALNDNKRALAAVNNALKVDVFPELLRMKVDLLRSNGQVTEAIAVYDKLLHLNAQINKDAFNRQIQQMRLLNDLNDKEKQASELAYQEEQLTLKQRLLFGVVTISVFLFVLLYILYVYYRRTHRLKNDLLQEKESLLVSEQKLREAKEQAEKANQMKTAFIANISHEVRTPLNAIVGFSELLAENDYDEESKRQFSTNINMNSELLLNLVNDILDLSRLESGNVKFKYAEVDIIQFGRRLMEEMQTRMTSEVKLVFSSSFESYTLNTDLYRVQQLLMNLLLNAIKFTQEGQITFSFEVDELKHEAVFSVADTGCGIPQEKQGRIFERFEKLDEFVQGTGLGLPICKMIANRFGGRIFIDTSYTDGARFIFIHPLMTIS